MRRFSFLLLFIAAGVLQSSTASPQRKALAWKIERIIITGDKLPKFAGVPVDKLRLMAFKNGKIAAIPFQVDQRDGEELFRLNSPDENKPLPPPNNKLDPTDELVFMAGDAGDRGAPARAAKYHEIQLFNPVDKTVAWAYLALYPDNPPPLSDVDYVKYTRRGDREEVITENYIQGFNDQHVFFDDLAILPPSGGNGRNFIDKLKMRTVVRLLGKQVKIARSEADFVTKVTGLKDGPVRVIRRADTRMILVLNMKTPSVVVEALFNRNSFEVPSKFNLPFRMDLVARDISFRQGIDMNENALNMRYYNNFMTRGTVFDGVMSPQEAAVAASDATQRWGMVTGAPGTFLYHGAWSTAMPMKKLAYLMDDASKKDPPENTDGLMMFGYRFEDVVKLKGETYEFNLIMRVVPNYNGDLNSIINLIDRPVVAIVR